MHQPASPRKAFPRGSTRAPSPAIARWAPLGAVAGANFALAFGPWFVRVADTGPVAAAFWRIALALPLLGVAAWWSERGRADRARAETLRPLLIPLALAGIAFALDLGSWHLGILRTTLANATLFGNSATFIFPIYGFVVARAWPTRAQALALLLAAAGAALLMGRSYSLDPRNLAGDLLCIAAGVLYAVYFVLMARARRTLAPLPALALSSLASLLPLLACALLLGERVLPDRWGALIGLALVSQVIGQGLMIYALGKLSPLVVGIALLIQPVVAATIGWLVYAEALGAADLIGAAMVAIALVLVRRSPRDVMNGTTLENLAPKETR